LNDTAVMADTRVSADNIRMTFVRFALLSREQSAASKSVGDHEIEQQFIDWSATLVTCEQ